MKLGQIFEETPPGEAVADAEPQFGYKDTAWIKEHIYPHLEAKIEKLNKRAGRLGLPPIKLHIQGEKMMKKDPNSSAQVKVYEVRIEGAAPKVAGYKFLATIDHKDGGNVIRTVPGQDGNEKIKDFYEARPDYCDHCKKRRSRIETFIIQDEKTGDLRQIGRNCLADFLPGIDPKAILHYFNMRDLIQKAISDADEEGRTRGTRHRDYLSVEHILQVGAALVRTYGYIKSTDQNGDRVSNSTANMVRTVLMPPVNAEERERQWMETARNLTPEDQAKAKQVVDWFNALPEQEKQNSQFYQNINSLLKTKDVESKDVGYVVALFPAWARANQQVQQRAQKSNEYLGAVGGKLPPTRVTVTGTQTFQGTYGYRPTNTQLIRMEDAAGNCIVWFNSGGPLEVQQGSQITIAGTIKKHDEFRGRKQTTLTRAKVSE